MLLADTISRAWTLDAEATNKTARVPHTQGILVETPFSPRSIISPADILEYVQRGDSNIVVGSSDPSVSKSSQTDTERPTTSTVMEVQILDQGVSKRAQTGIRQGIPNRAPLNVPFFATLIH